MAATLPISYSRPPAFTVWENAGMPENYRFMMDYEYQEKKKEIY
jgi:hypothetical protein